MEFKMFLLCFAILVAATSAASVCKCEEKKESIYKYALKMNDGVKEIEEEVKIDTEQNTETYRIPQTDSRNAGEVDIVYDFKTNVTMRRISSAKACFLSEFDEAIPKPSDLVMLLDQLERNKSLTTFTNTKEVEYEVVSTVTDRSELSDEMAFMCAKLPIYRIKKTTPFSVMVKRVRRDGHCEKTVIETEYICGEKCPPLPPIPQLSFRSIKEPCVEIRCIKKETIIKCYP